MTTEEKELDDILESKHRHDVRCTGRKSTS